MVAGIIAIMAPFLFADCSKKKSQQFASNPNIILFFIDDMGYGDIEPFGSRMNKTPNLNILAEEGLRFSQFYLASVQCSPSRAALLTGCYAERVGMNGRVCFPNEGKALNPDELTLMRTEEGKWIVVCNDCSGGQTKTLHNYRWYSRCINACRITQYRCNF